MVAELIGAGLMVGLFVIGHYGSELKDRRNVRGSINLSKEVPKKKD